MGLRHGALEARMPQLYLDHPGAPATMAETFLVESPDVTYSKDYIEAKYMYSTVHVSREDGVTKVKPHLTEFTFRTERQVPRLGVMLVGWGGNNGTTVTAAVLANRLGLSWMTKTGRKHANYYGSLLQASTVCLGTGPTGDVYVPFRDLLPMVHPNDLHANYYGSLLQASTVCLGTGPTGDVYVPFRDLLPMVHPNDLVFDANQEERADNVLHGTKAEQVAQIRRDIQEFKVTSGVDKVVVLWTANTERFCDVLPGVNDTAANLLQAIETVSIVSYNHLGNNDGKNLSAPQQFRSKEVSKSNVVDDMVQSNPLLYGPQEKPDHCVVIKYVPYVGDSKRALDEYTSEIMMGGTNTIVLHNTCEDSLLASPIILDLAILTELCQRISFCTESDPDFQGFHSVLSILGFLCKAPLVPEGSPVVNALFRQRSCIENILRACVGLPPQNHMLLEHKMQRPCPSLKRARLAECPVSHKRAAAQVKGSLCPASNGHGTSPAQLHVDN
ncbi:Inositol-3-phosphate synthase 1 [Chelonia mydas]|uniref:inositol-3-phosphate synthase n=1 Tax=Chelonia mydas TaxID=8469 RepID=M7AWC6_CHEMY|nr:Inositol-3-phosphate synthase 1 [Chelonia mydas]